jgi:hypothetical protein
MGRRVKTKLFRSYRDLASDLSILREYVQEFSEEKLKANIKRHERNYVDGQGWWEDVMPVLELYWNEETRRAKNEKV